MMRQDREFEVERLKPKVRSPTRSDGATAWGEFALRERFVLQKT
jgi:hypothetical protein